MVYLLFKIDYFLPINLRYSIVTIQYISSGRLVFFDSDRIGAQRFDFFSNF